ncbi:unnamed protein product [Lampetra fluviatilis]
MLTHSPNAGLLASENLGDAVPDPSSRGTSVPDILLDNNNTRHDPANKHVAEARWVGGCEWGAGGEFKVEP